MSNQLGNYIKFIAILFFGLIVISVIFIDRCDDKRPVSGGAGVSVEMRQLLDSAEQRLADIIGSIESDNRYYMVNRNGMLGRFQFNVNTILSLFRNLDTLHFLSDSLLQVALFRYYLSYLRTTYHRYLSYRVGNCTRLSDDVILVAMWINPSATIRYLRCGCTSDIKLDTNISIEQLIRKLSN